MAGTRISLVVLYCADLSACRDFYQSLGLVFEPERHAAGPEHYAATLADGAVLELYPAGRRGATGTIRLGLTAHRNALGQALESGAHTLHDPEGRVIDLRVVA